MAIVSYPRPLMFVKWTCIYSNKFILKKNQIAMALLNFILLFTIVLCIVHTFFLSKNLIKSGGKGGCCIMQLACHTQERHFFLACSWYPREYDCLCHASCKMYGYTVNLFCQKYPILNLFYYRI